MRQPAELTAKKMQTKENYCSKLCTRFSRDPIRPLKCSSAFLESTSNCSTLLSKSWSDPESIEVLDKLGLAGDCGTDEEFSNSPLVAK